MTTIINDEAAFIALSVAAFRKLSDAELTTFITDMRSLPEDLQDASKNLIEAALMVCGERVARQYEIEVLAEELEAFAA